MNKIIIALIAVSLLAASCGFGNNAAVGVVKTANGGVDWQSANQIAGTDKSLLEKSISQMKFNTAGDKIYASSFSGGLYSSDDAAENWTAALGNISVYDFAFDPYDDQVIYAAAYLSEKGRVLVTRDGTKSWTEIYSDVGGKNPVRALAVNPSNPSEIMIGTGKGALIVSRDSGSSWELVVNYSDPINQIVWENDTIYVVVKNEGVFKSTDGGYDFDILTRGLRAVLDNGDKAVFLARPSDFRRMAINPSDNSELLLTTNRGLFRSGNGGESWNYVTMPFRPQAASPFAVAYASAGSGAVYVSSDAVIFKSTNGGNAWTASDTNTNGLVTAILVDRMLPQIAFAGVSE
jgi:photosystem II stability/assembly factor-like uncharacterized protein